jgi:hypothetical protein
MKLYIINTIAFGLSLTNIEITLRIVLLLVSIIYTIKKLKK